MADARKSIGQDEILDAWDLQPEQIIITFSTR
jgi:hypothetical protein